MYSKIKGAGGVWEDARANYVAAENEKRAIQAAKEGKTFVNEAGEEIAPKAPTADAIGKATADSLKDLFRRIGGDAAEDAAATAQAAAQGVAGQAAASSLNLSGYIAPAEKGVMGGNYGMLGSEGAEMEQIGAARITGRGAAAGARAVSQAAADQAATRAAGQVAERGAARAAAGLAERTAGEAAAARLASGVQSLLPIDARVAQSATGFARGIAARLSTGEQSIAEQMAARSAAAGVTSSARAGGTELATVVPATEGAETTTGAVVAESAPARAAILGGGRLGTRAMRRAVRAASTEGEVASSEGTELAAAAVAPSATSGVESLSLGGINTGEAIGGNFGAAFVPSGRVGMTAARFTGARAAVTTAPEAPAAGGSSSAAGTVEAPAPASAETEAAAAGDTAGDAAAAAAGDTAAAAAEGAGAAEAAGGTVAALGADAAVGIAGAAVSTSLLGLLGPLGILIGLGSAVGEMASAFHHQAPPAPQAIALRQGFSQRQATNVAPSSNLQMQTNTGTTAY